MSKTSKIPANAFAESTETIQQSDKRDELIAEIDADCKHLRELCWKMRGVYSSFLSKKEECERSASSGGRVDIDGLVKASTESAGLEKDITNLKDKIEKSLTNYNFGKSINERIYVSHTAEGLPICVSKQRKIPLWGI